MEWSAKLDGFFQAKTKKEILRRRSETKTDKLFEISEFCESCIQYKCRYGRGMFILGDMID